MTSPAVTAEAFGALSEGRWAEARAFFEESLAQDETGEASFGLATALWWLGENQASVHRCSRAYVLFRQAGETERAAQCAVWLSITYKANFANFAAANGWIARAERLLHAADLGPLHGWIWIARGYRMTDLDAAEGLTERALSVARASADVDLELVALAQLGLIRVGKGETERGFGLIDEALAAALAGERSSLDTVVYTCCDMLNACELASDLERAAQWCRVADDFVGRYGCPFLYAECRIYYGSVLTAKGRWNDAERELAAGVQITADACPGLHRRALSRLAGLRVRQGRLEEADRLLTELDAGVEAEAEVTLLTAVLALARGDAAAAAGLLERRLGQLAEHQRHRADALDLLVDAYAAAGRVGDAVEAAERLRAIAAEAGTEYVDALAAAARGRALLAAGDADAARALEAALAGWSSLGLPLEAARTRFHLAQALVVEPDSAVDHGRRALRALEHLGASHDADRVAFFLRSLGVVPRVGAKRTGALTRREREVLTLLGLGLTNPEIAARLHVSRKTASHHVSSVLTKLGLRNRAEAAAHAAVAAEGSAAAPRF